MSEIKVDTVAEKTSANGVTVDGLNIKDSKLVTANSVVTSNVTDLNITSGKIADDAITLAKMASGTDGNIISYDASGNPVAVATGSFGQVLTSAGAGSPPTFATPSSFTGLGYSSVYLTGDASISGSSYLSSNLGIYNQSPAGSGRVSDVTSGHITLDKTGVYYITYQTTWSMSSGHDVVNPYIRTWNGSGESNIAYGYVSLNQTNDSKSWTSTLTVIKDVDNVSNIKFHMGYDSVGSNIVFYGTGQSVTSMTFIRLGDT